MGISRRDQEKMALEIRRIYEKSELEIIADVARRLKEGIDVADWQTQKLTQLDALRRDVQKRLDEPGNVTPELIQTFIDTAYKNGGESVVEDLKRDIDAAYKRGEDPSQNEQLRLALFQDEEVPEDFNFQTDVTVETLMAINTEAVGALAGATTGAVTERHMPIVRSVEDVYRSVINEVVGSGVTGTQTRLEVAQRAYAKFIQRGVATFEAGGRSYDIASYAEMATRSAIGQAAIQGHMDQSEEMGVDLQAVSDHPEECEVCRPWEGKVLAIKGDTDDYPTVSEAMAAGLFHPRCGHRLHAYIPGLSELPEHTGDEEGYEERQQQRYLERGLRDWRKREAGALSDAERKKAEKKVKEWKGRINEFSKETGRRRKYERENIGPM